MDKEFIAMSQILETGTDIVSPHLRWLLRHAIIEHCGSDALNVITYCKDIPVNEEGKEIWAETFAPTKSIAINLHANFDSCIDQIQDEDKMYTALRTLLIRELLDSAIHEAHHLKASKETGDFSNSRLEEEQANAVAWKKSWLAAKFWDAEITTFGPFLDELLTDFMDSLKKDTKKKPVMWKDLQIYMWENQLAFYNPDLEQECQIREAFESMARTDDPWIDEPKKFLSKIAITPENLEETNGTIPDNITTTPEAIPAPITEQIAKEQIIPDYNPPPPTTTTTTQIEVPPPPTTVQPQQPTVPPPPPAINTPDNINVLAIQQAVEHVMRTLFIHVMTKCEPTPDGHFNNPSAVLEQISINHIPHATELFTHMDTTDATGVYSGNVPCNGFIKGLVSQQDLPMYRFYLNIGGHLYKRIFIPQNPDKLNANNELTKWAQEARDGAKIMMLLEDHKGPRAHIKLAPNTPFGQEEFKIWGDK